MHAIKDKPVVVDGKIVIRPIMVVALTFVPLAPSPFLFSLADFLLLSILFLPRPLSRPHSPSPSSPSSSPSSTSLPTA